MAKNTTYEVVPCVDQDPPYVLTVCEWAWRRPGMWGQCPHVQVQRRVLRHYDVQSLRRWANRHKVDVSKELDQLSAALADQDFPKSF